MISSTALVLKVKKLKFVCENLSLKKSDLSFE